MMTTFSWVRRIVIVLRGEEAAMILSVVIANVRERIRAMNYLVTRTTTVSLDEV
jgi:hypothetical protein